MPSQQPSTHPVPQDTALPHLLESLLVDREGPDHLGQSHGDPAHALGEGRQQARTLVQPVLVAGEAVQPEQIMGRHRVGAGLRPILVCRAQRVRVRQGSWGPGASGRAVASVVRGGGPDSVPGSPPLPQPKHLRPAHPEVPALPLPFPHTLRPGDPVWQLHPLSSRARATAAVPTPCPHHLPLRIHPRVCQVCGQNRFNPTTPPHPGFRLVGPVPATVSSVSAPTQPSAAMGQ